MSTPPKNPHPEYPWLEEGESVRIDHAEFPERFRYIANKVLMELNAIEIDGGENPHPEVQELIEAIRVFRPVLTSAIGV